MTHLDEETIALLALGEPPVNAADVDAHLDDCPACRSLLERLRATVTVGRSLHPDDMRLAPPPDRVWDGIAAELGLPSTVESEDAEVVELSTHAAHRSAARVTWKGWAAVAAAVLVVITVGSVVLARRSSGPGPTVQSVALAPVGQGDARGGAQLVRRGGGLALRLDTTGLPTTPDGYYELWLMNPDTNSFISFGPVVPGTTATYPVPKGISVTSDPFVDISLEPFDGNPSHSTVSVLRGRFA